MKYTVRPISDRTAFKGASTASQFTVTYSQVEDLLDRELYYLNAHNIVIEVDVAENGIRLDGTLRADAKTASPAVRLAFDSKHGPLTYATDTFYRDRTWAYVGNGANRRRQDTMRHSWQHNLYAIALGLEALRKVDRYGITKRGEQYAGWKALPPGGIALGQGMTREVALATIAKVVRSDNTGEPIGLAEIATGLQSSRASTILRRAKAAAHPDKHNGDRVLWDQVETAARILGIAS